MKHLLSLTDIDVDTIHTLIERARAFKQKKAPWPSFPDKAAALLFYENSTRTIMSFSLACDRLQLKTHSLDLNHSSEKKGESLLDTLLTLHAMGFHTLIMRHHQDRFYEPLLPFLPASLHLINAGDGQHQHPSQALLDMMTISEAFPHLEGLKIAMVGDIRHSRVAHSLIALCKQLSITLTCIAPPPWQETGLSFAPNLKSGLDGADVIIVLRVQKERLEKENQLCLETYHKQYALTETTLSYAKKNALVLHPGPINRGIEIDAEVADGPQSAILKQVENGVWMRMAVIDWLTK